MSFLNLTIVEFLAILLPVSAAIVALYFYDRSRRRRIVSTLRFWPQRPDPPMVTRRRKLQQPLSLLLQLLALLLLLLAIADLRWGEQAGMVRRHVVILDTSAWMGTVTAGGPRLIDLARQRARAYLNAVPASEPVMLIRGDANPAPITPFTTDRQVLEDAIAASEPSWTSIDLNAAFEAARSALALHVPGGGELAGHSVVGEVAYVGSGRGAESRGAASRLPRVRWIEARERIADLGVSELIARRLPDDPERWEVRVELFHAGGPERKIEAEFLFAGKMLGTKTLLLPPNGAKELTFQLRTRRAGRLEVRTGSADRFVANDRAALDLPAYRRHQVDVYSAASGGLRSLLGANPNLDARFHTPRNYEGAAGMVAVFEGFSPAPGPQSDLVYFSPPRESSPAVIARIARQQRITCWNGDHPLARGLRTRDVVLEETAVFDPEPDDVTIAECEAGPVVIARLEKGRKRVFFGFSLSDAGLRGRPAAPLLFANTMAWIFPDSFRSSELRAQSPGLIEIEVGEAAEEDIVVHSEEDPDLPWSYRDGKVRLFTSTPGNVDVRTPTTETHLALTLPEVASGEWSPPEDILRGVPPRSAGGGESLVFWPWLAAFSIMCLLVEWKFFGRESRGGPATSVESGRSEPFGLGLSDTGSLATAGPGARDRDIAAREKEAVR